MKRAMIALIATAAGVVWVVTYRVSPHAAGLAAAPRVHPSPPAPTASAAPSPSGRSGVFTGADVTTIFGDTQVQVVLSNGRITDVRALHLPYDRPTSQYISSVAGPDLRQEALQAQSANIDVISGATYTSEAYARSLEDALRAGGLG